MIGTEHRMAGIEVGLVRMRREICVNSHCYMGVVCCVTFDAYAFAPGVGGRQYRGVIGADDERVIRRKSEVV